MKRKPTKRGRMSVDFSDLERPDDLQRKLIDPSGAVGLDRYRAGGDMRGRLPAVLRTSLKNREGAEPAEMPDDTRILRAAATIARRHNQTLARNIMTLALQLEGK